MRTFTLIVLIAVFFSSVLAANVQINIGATTSIQSPGNNNVQLTTNLNNPGTATGSQTSPGGGSTATHHLSASVNP